MENDLKNLQQEVLRLTQRLIALENKPAPESKADNSVFNLMIDKLSIRIATLEEARQRQIKFNTIAAKRLDDYGIILAKPKKFWPF